VIVLTQFVVRPHLGDPPEKTRQLDLKGRERDGYVVRSDRFRRSARLFRRFAKAQMHCRTQPTAAGA
jgi:hypothetical protein